MLLMAVEWSLTGYFRQLLASRGVRMAADPCPEGELYKYTNNFYVRADPVHATLLVPGAPEDRPRAPAECVWRPFYYVACAGVGWAFKFRNRRYLWKSYRTVASLRGKAEGVLTSREHWVGDPLSSLTLTRCCSPNPAHPPRSKLEGAGLVGVGCPGMSSIGTGYDQSTTTFSPDGRVFQVEYATKAVDNSSTAVGIRCKDGVVMCVEKPKLSKMLVEGTNRRIMTVDMQSGICISGMVADARQIVNYARREATGYLDFYGGSIPGTVLANRISGMMHTYTLYWYELHARFVVATSC